MLAGAALLAGAVAIGRVLAESSPGDKIRDTGKIVYVVTSGGRIVRVFGTWKDGLAWAKYVGGRAEGHSIWKIADDADLSGLSGAVKVCVAYKRGPGGKIRCRQWSSGAGYVPGPQAENEYAIPDVRSYYATELCADPKNKRKCGLSRKYHYRQSLPYVPRERAKSNPAIPSVARQGAVRILNVSPAPAIVRTRVKSTS